MDSAKRVMTRAADMVKPPSENAATEVGDPSPADATWAAMMIPHHRTGIEMAELAIGKAATAALREMAAKSVAEQKEDLPRLERIIAAAGRSAMPPQKPVERMNKLHTRMLQSLSGPEFDLHWATVVSGHHVSAVMMTDVAMAASGSHGVTALQEELRAKQLKELDELNDFTDRLQG